MNVDKLSLMSTAVREYESPDLEILSVEIENAVMETSYKVDPNPWS